MTNKITPPHLQKTAYVYIRQSSMGQVRHHRESTERQYALQDTSPFIRLASQVESKYSTVTWDVLVRQRRIALTSRRSLPMCRLGNAGSCPSAGGITPSEVQRRLASADRDLRYYSER